MSNMRRFNSSPFTLQEHCGSHAKAVAACLLRYNCNPHEIPATDTSDEANHCRLAWSAFRHCGSELIAACDWAPKKCKPERDAHQACLSRASEPKDCEQLELAVLLCASVRITAKMSGQPLPT